MLFYTLIHTYMHTYIHTCVFIHSFDAVNEKLQNHTSRKLKKTHEVWRRTLDLHNEEILLMMILISQSQKNTAQVLNQLDKQAHSISFYWTCVVFHGVTLRCQAAELGLTTTSSIPTFRPPPGLPWHVLFGLSAESAADILNNTLAEFATGFLRRIFSTLERKNKIVSPKLARWFLTSEAWVVLHWGAELSQHENENGNKGRLFY